MTIMSEMAAMQEALQDLQSCYPALWEQRHEPRGWPQEYSPIVKLFRAGEEAGLISEATSVDQVSSPSSTARGASEDRRGECDHSAEHGCRHD